MDLNLEIEAAVYSLFQIGQSANRLGSLREIAGQGAILTSIAANHLELEVPLAIIIHET